MRFKTTPLPLGLFLVVLTLGQAAARAQSDDTLPQQAYRITLAREPTPEELDQAVKYIESYPRDEDGESDHQVRAWKSFCRLLMTSNEFNFVN